MLILTTQAVDNYTAFMEYSRSIVKRFDEKESFLLRLGAGDYDRDVTDLELEVLNNSMWSGLVYDRSDSNVNKANEMLNAKLQDKKRRSQWKAAVLHYCESTQASFNFSQMIIKGLSSPQPDCTSGRTVWMLPPLFVPSCKQLIHSSPLLHTPPYSVLDTVKTISTTNAKGKVETVKHWQVVAVVIDRPYEKRVFDEVYAVGVLDALDLTFLRPKLILVRLVTTMDTTDNFHASQAVIAVLARHGYSTGSTDAAAPLSGNILFIWGVLGNSFQK